MFEVIEARGARAWKRVLRVCVRCWSACLMSPWSVLTSGRPGGGSCSATSARTVLLRSTAASSRDTRGWFWSSGARSTESVGVAQVTMAMPTLQSQPVRPGPRDRRGPVRVDNEGSPLGDCAGRPQWASSRRCGTGSGLRLAHGDGRGGRDRRTARGSSRSDRRCHRARSR